MKAISRLKILLGLLQASHYDMVLFYSWLARHPRPADWDAFREKVTLDWTWKAWFLFWTSITVSLLIPLSLRMNMLLLWPFEWLATRWVCAAARRHMQNFKFHAAIGITGSFGKTTTKEILAQILGQKFRVHKTPGNVNTLLGVARWILRESFADGDIVIVEMGAYRRGDIKEICDMVRPTVGIMTGLNEAHRERFGSLEQTAAAKCELFDALPRGGLALWNKDSAFLNQGVLGRIARWEERGLRPTAYSCAGAGDIKIEVLAVGERSTRFRIMRAAEPMWTWEGETALLGAHTALPLAATVRVASILSMSREEIARGLERLRPLERRLYPILSPGDRLVIDDSYNITLDGLKAALEFLNGIKRRKIGVFAGIPEAGPDTAAVNTDFGGRIGEIFDVVLLRETPVSISVRRGLKKRDFPEGSIIGYDGSGEVEQILSRIVRDGDCTYFSAYDWPGIYL